MIANMGDYSSVPSEINQNVNGNSQSCFTQVLTQCVSSHVLSGLCKIGGYEILRHGTSWSNYKSILATGVDLSKGGKTTEDADGNYITCTSEEFLPDGSSRKTVTKILKTQTSLVHNRHAANARNKFYVFRDSKFGIDKEGNYVISRWLIPFGQRLGPIQHSCLAYLAQYIKEDENGEEKGWMIVAAFIQALFTPKLKFIYSLQEIEGTSEREKIFENDPDYSLEGAYRTSQALSTDRIGLIGFINHVEANHVWKHIKDNPGEFILGIIQLAIGIILTAIPVIGFLT